MAVSTRDRILDAAEARFAGQGYSAASMGEIASDVGIRAPSLYKHFESKKALYRAVLKRLLDPYFVMLEGLLSAAADSQHAQRNLETVVRHYYEAPNLARLVQHAALARGEEMEILLEDWFDPFIRRAAELSAATPALQGDPRHAVYLVIAFHSMMSGYVTMAPLHARLLGGDPLSRRAREAHLAFMKTLADKLWVSARGRRAGAARRRRR